MKRYEDLVLGIVGETVGRLIGPESLHPDYVKNRDARQASMYLSEGKPALVRDAAPDSRGQISEPYGSWTDKSRLPPVTRRRFIRPTTQGEVTKQRGQTETIFETKVKNMHGQLVYAEAVRSCAALPFSGRATFEGWPPAVESRLRGEGPGVDGRRSSLMTFYKQAFESKLFAGVHFVHLTGSSGFPTWEHLEADYLLDWDWIRVDGVPVLLGVNIHQEDGVRLTYNTVPVEGGVAVVWHVWRYTGKTWEVMESGTSATGTVPIVPMYTDWITPYYSPAPFSDAADSQMQAVRQQMELDRHAMRVASAPILCITNWTDGVVQGENGEAVLNPIPLGPEGLAFESDAKVTYLSMSGENIPVLMSLVQQILDGVRRQCMDPIRATRDGEVKATEIRMHASRTTSYLQALVMSDIASLTELARLSSLMIGATPPENASIRIPTQFDSVDKLSLLAEVKELADRGIIDNLSVIEAVQSAYPSLPESIVERNRLRARELDRISMEEAQEG